MNHEANTQTLHAIADLYQGRTSKGERHLNLSPGFQRDSVWTLTDRKKLIDSIVRNYPLPAIFLYRREENGEIIYDVIDGKQRIESILMFMGLIRGQRYWAKVQLPGGDEKEWVDWATLCKKKKQHLITGYKLLTIEIDGEGGDIIELFVRINSTGKALTAAEKRNARYYNNSEFLSRAAKLASKYKDYLLSNKILSLGQMTRMKHVELMCELMLSIYQGDVINKKAAVDKMMKADSLTESQAKTVEAQTILVLNRLIRIFPELSQTRLRQLSDFYSLAVLISKFETEKLILTDRKRNALAWDLLSAFAVGVDQVRDMQKQARGTPPELENCREYLLTVTQSTDEISQRKKREGILRQLLESLFLKKDSQRLFSPEQRRIIWNSAGERLCSECGKPVTWMDFTVDHIKPHSKGGRTKLDNAAIMHRSCNASIGNRKK